MPERELREVFAAVFGAAVPVGDFTRDAVQEWDSLGHVKLVLELEARLGVRVAPADIARLHSDFAAVRAYVERARREVVR
ncbi:MAG TPA: acyl carrier protein [Candidatus Krumholzibacteria bacterium]|nr:acyl carrier protein [Candidatus Krumholzibacteria bacterium]HPD71793.1 acyl carrier protein [Candidatus Krumholzibacteria bacterium]HRY41274.1 acyl carrier protein [Candidatus Krumholzibacteria bacterium]